MLPGGYVRKLLISALVVYFSVAAAWADVKMGWFSGDVRVSRDGRWSAAGRDTALERSDRVKTGPNSRALMIVDGTSRVWIGQNAEVEVSSVGEESAFGLLLGKLRAKVKLMAGRRFKVKTPVCVASVRGTEFALSYDGVLEVLEGRVEFADMLKSMVEIAADHIGVLGADGAVGVPRAMTTEERERMDREWHEAMALEQQSQSSSDNNELRGEMHAMVGETRADMAQGRELTNEIKDADFSTGRTLRDAHGNLVRVEQHILRPDDRSMEFLNLTKRPEYRYSDPLGQAGTHGFSYAGPSGSRLDVMDVVMTMNMSMPDQMTDWPSYIADKGDGLHPERVYGKLTNQYDKIEFIGNWSLKGTPDPDNGNRELEEDKLVFDSYINGYKVDKTYDSLEDGIHSESEDNLYAWGVTPDLKIVRPSDNDTKYIKLYTESYVINNGGGIMTLNDFTSGTGNPFITLKQIAGEYVVFGREYNTSTQALGSNLFSRGNLDLVITPDIGIAVAQKLATQMDKIRNDSNSGN